MKKNKIDVCGLSETKLVSSKLQLMHKLRLKQWRMFSNVEATSVARIVVLGILPRSMWIQLTPLPKLCMSLSETWKLSSPVLPPLSMVTTLLVLASPFRITLGGGLLHALGLYLVFLSSLLPV